MRIIFSIEYVFVLSFHRLLQRGVRMRDAVPERTRRVLSRRAKVLSQHALQRESQIVFGGCDVVVVVVVVGGGDVGLRTTDEGDDLVPTVQVGDDVRC